MNLPSHLERLVPESGREVFAKAYGSALERGFTPGSAALAGFKAVEPSRVALLKCKLELFRKEAAAQVFYAWASVVEKQGGEVSDWEGDGWPAADMEQAAWNFNSTGGAHGIRHGGIAAGSELVASMPFTADLQKALGIDLGQVGWLVGFRVSDGELWDQIEKGDLPMLSIGGAGIREPVQ